MGRPPLPVGTFGKIGFLLLPSGEVQARARFRDFDGRTRLVSKTGATRASAERALKTELAARRGPGGAGVITASSRVSALVEAWMDADHGWSTGTERTYRSVIRTSVLPAFGQLTLQEGTPRRGGRALTANARTRGGGGRPGTHRNRTYRRARCCQDRPGVPVRHVLPGHRRRRHRRQPRARRHRPD